MKTIDTKSLLLGVLATVLVLTLTSSKNQESDNLIDFVASPNGVGIYNKYTKTIYLYKCTLGGFGLQESPGASYEITDGGSSLKKRE